MDKAAFDILKAFKKDLKSKNADLSFKDAQKELKEHPAENWYLCKQWVITFLENSKLDASEGTINEVAGFIMTDAADSKQVQTVSGIEKIEKLKTIIGKSDQDDEKAEKIISFQLP